MSGPIRSTITFNLSSMTNVKPRNYECPVDPNQSAEVNALVLTAAHQRVREAIRVVHTCLDDRPTKSFGQTVKQGGLDNR